VTRATKLLGIIVVSFAISACAGLLESKQPAERVYWLEPLIVQQEASTDAVLPGIAVSVTAVPGLDTDRMLILGPDAHLNYYASARWPDSIAEVLESLLRSTLESTGRYSRVTRGATSQSTDLHLDLEVRELYALANATNSAHTVRMVLKGYLDCIDDERAIVMQAVAEIRDNRLTEIVAAYQEALGKASQQLVEQTAESCGAATSKTN
jgi:ABC-type uncharacterized transport system auxiliary subunit